MNKTVVKKLLRIFLFFSPVVIVYILFFQTKYKIVEYNLEGKTYRLYLADTPKKWSSGLMYLKKKPDGIDGMLFSFPEVGYRTFYNKNTYLDLDIYWIKNSSVVGKGFLPSVRKTGGVIVYITSPQEVDTVVEIIR